jgi:hypothetical protein
LCQSQQTKAENKTILEPLAETFFDSFDDLAVVWTGNMTVGMKGVSIEKTFSSRKYKSHRCISDNIATLFN